MTDYVRVKLRMTYPDASLAGFGWKDLRELMDRLLPAIAALNPEDRSTLGPRPGPARVMSADEPPVSVSTARRRSAGVTRLLRPPALRRCTLRAPSEGPGTTATRPSQCGGEPLHAARGLVSRRAMRASARSGALRAER